MSRYKSTKLSNLGPVHGFIIHTPDDRKLRDVYPQFIVRELNRMADRINKLEEKLMHVMNKHAMLVADVVLNEDRAERIKQLEDRIKQMEEAGDRLKDRYILENENWDLQTVNDWNDAKEAKL